MMKSFLLIITVPLVATGFIAPATRFTIARGRKYIIPSPIIDVPSVELNLRPIDDEDNVNVNLIPDVDAFTLTAVGFGLIAFNFLVLANVSTAVLQLTIN